MSEVAVAFEGVAAAYGDVSVLRAVDLAVQAGTTTAIVGESGSGKSTLLQMINALIAPSAGRVCVFGQDVAHADPVTLRRGIGFAVQGGALFPHLTVRQNIVLPGVAVGREADWLEARMRELLQRVELDVALAERHPFELSGGQQQRVSLCRALVLQPPLLLLDEPFSAVDPITRIGIHEHFANLAASESVTVVLVTHDLREAVHLASDLVVLGEGGVMQAGAVDEVIHEPAAPWIARLFADQLSDAGGKQ